MRIGWIVVLIALLGAGANAQGLTLLYDQPGPPIDRLLARSAGALTARRVQPAAYAAAIRAEPQALFIVGTAAALAALAGLADLSALWTDTAPPPGDAATRALFSLQGRAVALPVSTAPWVVFVNRKILADNGIPRPPTSWSALLDACTKLKEGGDRALMGTLQDGWRATVWFAELLVRTDPDAYRGLLDGSRDYDGPEVQRVMQIWYDMHVRGCFADPRSTDEPGDFARGRAAMMLATESTLPAIRAAGLAAADALGVFVFPTILPMDSQPLIIDAIGLAAPAALAARGDLAPIAAALFTPPPTDEPLHAALAALAAGPRVRRLPRFWDAAPPPVRDVAATELARFMLDPGPIAARRAMSAMQAANRAYRAAPP